ELPADLPAGVGAEQAGDLGLVLEGLTDRARDGGLAGFVARRRRADPNRLIGAAGGGFLVVLVARVGGHPVVGAGLREARALRRCVFAVGGVRDRARGGDEAASFPPRRSSDLELPADLPAGVGAEQAGDLGLVLEGL